MFEGEIYLIHDFMMENIFAKIKIGITRIVGPSRPDGAL